MNKLNITLLFISPPKWALIFFLLLNKIGIKVLFTDKKGMKQYPNWKEAINKKKLTQIVQPAMAPYHSNAINQAEYIINSLSDTREIHFLRKITKDSKTDILPKRLLAEKFLTFFHSLDILNSQPSEGYIVSFEAIRLNSLCTKLGTAKGIKIPFGRIIGANSVSLSILMIVISYIKRVGPLFIRSLYLTYNAAAISKKTPSKLPQTVAIALGFPWQMKFTGPRIFHFLVDDHILKKENVIFCDEIKLNAEQLAFYSEKGWHFLPYHQTSQAILRNKSVRLSSSQIKLISCLWRASIFANSEEVHQSLKILGDEFISAIYLKQTTSTKVYVYCNKDHTNQFARNIALRSLGISSVWYPLFIGSPAIFKKASSPHDPKEILWYGQNPSHLFLYSKAAVESHKKHNQDVKDYHYYGSLFGDLIMKRKKDTNKIPSSSQNNNEKVICIFDTTYIDYHLCPTSFEHALAFLADIYFLAQQFPKYIINIKPSKPDSYFVSHTSLWASPKIGRKIINKRKELSLLANVNFFSDNTDPIDLIANSDVIITDGLSSPTADALSIGKKAFWYDPTHSHHGYPFDIAGFISHGKNELIAKVQALLDKTDEQFIEELNRNLYFKKNITPNLKVNALNELRKTIRQEATRYGSNSKK